MYKKTLLSLAVASSLALTGCFESGSNSNAGAGTDSELSSDLRKQFKDFEAQFDGKTWPAFNPGRQQFPIPNDFLLTSTVDGSFVVPADDPQDPNPVEVALNNISGASTTAPIDIPIASSEGPGLLNNETVRGFQEAEFRGGEQTVYLFEVQYDEAPSVLEALADEADGVEEFEKVSVEVINREIDDNVTQDFIRIEPTTPLDPNKRYTAVVTTGIKDQQDNALSRSPSLVQLISPLLGDESAPPIAAPLEGASGLTQRWFGTALSSGVVGPGDIALAYNFTTSNDREVMSYIADPELWIQDQAAAQGLSDDLDQTAVQGLLASVPFPELGNTNPEFMDAVNLDGTDAERTGVNALQATGALTLLDYGPDNPAPVNVHQGSLELPYYLGVPDEEDGRPIVDGSWLPDDGLASNIETFINSNLELEDDFGIPQSDPDVSEVLNYNFPFPREADESPIRSPLLVLTPADVDNASALWEDGDYDAVIFQHGITTDRSAAIAFGTRLIDNYDGDADGLVVFAIDQPLHGIATSPLVSGDEEADPTSSWTGWTTLALDGLDEKIDDAVESFFYRTSDGDDWDRNSLTSTDVGETDNDFVQLVLDAAQKPIGDDRNGAVVALQVAVESEIDEQISEDHVVIDTEGNTAPANAVIKDSVAPFHPVLVATVAGSGSTLAGLTPQSEGQGVSQDGITERHFGYGADDDQNPEAMQFDPEDAKGKSGDNFINLQNFLANRDNLRQGAIDLLNLRATIYGFDAINQDGVYFVGHSLGAVNGAAFLAAAENSGKDELEIAGSHLVTPASGIVRMLENSPSFAPRIIAGLAGAETPVIQGTPDFETTLRVLQHTLDTVDPVSFASELKDTNVLIGQVDRDLTTPNAVIEESNTLIDSLRADGSHFEAPLRDNPPLDVTLEDESGERSFSPIQSSSSTLAGSEQLARLLGAAPVDGDSVGLPAIMRHSKGAHSTPVLPAEQAVASGDVFWDGSAFKQQFPDDAECPDDLGCVVKGEDAVDTFDRMVDQTISLIKDGTVDE